jgi:Ca2+-binding RTX toxin-like protein
MRRGRRSAGCAAAATVAIALVPAAAAGSTVSADGIGVITFQAAPGERNVPSFTVTGDRLEVSDAGSSVSPGPGCATEDGKVLCPGTQVVVHAGDEADTVILTLRGDYTPNDVIYGEEGDDTLTGHAYGGPGNDTLTPLGFDDLDGGPGNDVLLGAGFGSSFEGGDGDDRLTGPLVNGSASGGDGHDVIDTPGARWMSGGPGNDRLVARACPSCFWRALLDGGEGDDELLGSSVTDEFRGGPGADVIRANATEDVGDSAGFEVEVVSGGPGNDLLEVGGAKLPDPVPMGIALTGLTPPEYLGFTASSVDGGQGDDRLVGGPNRDLLAGGEGDDYIDGGDGFDALAGGEGSDELHGGDKSDRLDGGPAPDLIDGGPGDLDGVDLRGASGPLAIDLTRAGKDGPEGENDNYLPSVEQFVLSEFADRFVAGRSSVSVVGGLGDDALTGGSGDDVLNGDGYRDRVADYGDDTIEGGAGNDQIDGDPGNDRIRGGPGDDLLSGGRSIIISEGGSTRYPSDDTIAGGRGDDRIHAGWRVSGGPGDDNINTADFRAANHSPVIPLGRDGNVGCGKGHDIARADYYDGLGLDCETILEGASPWHSVRPASGGRVTLIGRCAWDFRAPCRGTARLVRTSSETFRDRPSKQPEGCRKGAGTLGRHPFNLRAGRVNRIAIELSPRARRALGRARCLLVRADLRFKDPKGVSHEMTRTLALRPPVSWR